MKDTKTITTFGNLQKAVQLSFVFGASSTIHIMMDKYYQGVFVKQTGEWVAHLNSRSELCSNDVEVMKELLERYI